MKSSIALLLGDEWFVCHENQWVSIRPWDNGLRSVDAVITDFEGAPVDQQTLDVKAEFAPAVIEKKLRMDGALDGAAHILVHASSSHAGGTRLLYTGVPVEHWQRLNQWQSQQDRAAPIFGLPDLMLAQTRGDGMVAMRAGRSLMLLQRQAGRLRFHGIRSLSESADDIAVAIRGLISELGFQDGGERKEKLPCLAFDLYRRGLETPWELLADQLDLELENLPSAPIEWPDSSSDAADPSGWTALPSLAEPSVLKSLSPTGDKMLACMTRYQNPLAAAVFLIAIVLLMGSGYLKLQGEREEQILAGLEQELEQTRASLKELPSAEEIMRSGELELGLLESLSGSVGKLGMQRVLMDIRDSLEPGIRILRVSADQGGWILEGAEDAETQSTMAGFLRQMQLRGYLMSVNSNPGSRAVRGYFSYRLSTQGGAM